MRAAGDNDGMRPRLIAGLVLGVLALPIVFLGLIDPLEGGLALLLALTIGVVVRLLSGVPVPRLAWISMVATLAIGVLALALAIAGMPGSMLRWSSRMCRHRIPSMHPYASSCGSIGSACG